MDRRFGIIPPLLLLFSFVACERNSGTIVDPRGTAPLIGPVLVTPGQVNTDTMNIGPVRDPADVLTIPVHITASLPASVSGTAQYSIGFAGDDYDIADGVFPGADSAVSATIPVQFTRSRIGQLLVRVWVLSHLGDASPQAIKAVTISRLNHAPLLSDLVAPDTVSPSLISLFTITVRVSDPDGLQDIASVFRSSESGKTFPLNDAGLNGDAAPGDGIFTEQVSLSPAPAPGSYLFTFRAVDRSRDTSNVLRKTIVVMP